MLHRYSKIVLPALYTLVIALLLYVLTGYTCHFHALLWDFSFSLLLGLWLSRTTPVHGWLLLPLLASLSTLFIFPMAEQIVSPWDIYYTLFFLIGLFLGGSSLGLLLPKPMKRGFFFLFYLLYLLPAFLLWGYFSISGSWPSSDTLIAVYQTNPSEAWGYLCSHLSLPAGLCVPLFLICLYDMAGKSAAVTYTGSPAFRRLFGVTLLAAGMIEGFFFGDNLWTSLWIDAQVEMSAYTEFQRQQEAHSHEPRTFSFSHPPLPGLFVLVIGESENRTHMAAYGYDRDTTPWLSSMEGTPHMLRFTDAYSCHVQTVQSLSYGLTDKNQYNDQSLSQAVTLLEAAKAAGYDTWWISNQIRYGLCDTPVSIMASGANHQIWLNKSADHPIMKSNFYDEKILESLASLPAEGNQLVVIHLMGNHMPYLLRYPPEYSRYHGDNENIDRYDNSVRYNDFVMQQLYERLRQMPNFQAMVYCSDHGEDLAESLNHDAATYRPSMATIPFYMVLSDNYQKAAPATVEQLQAHREARWTNDLLFNAMLGLMGIRAETLDEPTNDITQEAYDTTPSRFRTLYGQKTLES